MTSAWHLSKLLVWSVDCLIWGLFPGLQNVPSPILSSLQKGLNSTNKCWTWADTKPQLHTDLQGENFQTAQCGYLNILGMRRDWSWRCLVVLEKHTRPYFTKYLSFSFCSFNSNFSFPTWECYAWNVQIPLICSIFLFLEISPPAAFFNSGLCGPTFSPYAWFSLWVNLSSSILFSKDAWSFQPIVIHTRTIKPTSFPTFCCALNLVIDVLTCLRISSSMLDLDLLSMCEKSNKVHWR